MELPEDNPLKPTKGDLAHTVTKAVVAAVPVIGSSAAELLGALIRPPVAKRLEAWCEGITQRLAELEKQFALDPASLPANEEFISTVQHATQIAMRTHQEEKIEALRNAVLNVAVGTTPGADLQLMFMTFVDAFTPWHLRVLRFFQKPELFVSVSTLPPSPTLYQVIGEAFSIGLLPEGFFEQVFRDLKARSLIGGEDIQESYRAESLHVYLSKEQVTAKRTTLLGDAFLAFIESPRQQPKRGL